MHVTDLADTVWEELLVYLSVHHLARLYLTGDSLMQRTVVHARRTTDFLPMEASPSLTRVLLPKTTKAIIGVAQTQYLCTLDAAATSRIRSIDVSYGFVVDEEAASHATVNLTTVAHLERLALDRPMPGCQLLLPRSLTCLHIADWSEPRVLNFGDLVSLTSLRVGLTSSMLRRFGHDHQWPPHLTSLAIEALRQSEEEARSFRTCLHLLPPALLSLTLINQRLREAMYDVVPPVVCTALETYRVVGLCTYGGPEGSHNADEPVSFPPSLKRLHVETLKQIPATLVDALAASSLTRVVLDHARVWSVEVAQRICEIMPKFDWDSADAMLRAVIPWVPHNDKLAEGCERALVQLGLGAHYLTIANFVHNRVPVTDAVKTALENCPHVRRFAKEDGVDGAGHWFHRSLTSAGLYPLAMRLGMIDTVTLGDLRRLGREPLHCRVRTLDMASMAANVSVADLLASHDLSHIEDVTITTCGPDRALLALDENVHRFSSLQRVAWGSTVYPLHLAHTIRSVMAKARLYPRIGPPQFDDGLPSVFTYRVTPPRR